MKKLVSLFLIITIITVTINSDVYALVGTVDTYISGIKNVCDMFVSSASPDEQETIQMMDKLLQSGGFISDIEKVGLDGALAQPYIRYMASQIEANQAEATMQDNIACIKEALESGYSSDGNNVSISDSFKTALVNTANYYVSQNEAYVYTFKQSEISSFPTGANQYNAINKVVMLHSSPKGSIFEYYKDTNNQNYIGVIDLREHPYLVLVKRNNSLVNTNYPRYRDVLYYDGGTNTQITTWDYTYKYDNQEGEFLQVDSNAMNNTAYNIFKTNNVSDIYSLNPMNMPNFSNTVGSLRFFNSASEITPNKILFQPYYYNNEVWQDFSSSSGGYTYSPSNINTVNYGDVTSYIDSFNTENGVPPTIPEIEINIKNEDTSNKDTSSGGGSGSGGDDSGDDDPTNIFGWLKQLGKVLGDLIKGLGEFLTEVVTGLVAALTNLLSGIGDLISNITETLPSAFMDWFSSLFQWMPEEWKALLSASLVFMVLYGIIKVIRG